MARPGESQSLRTELHVQKTITTHRVTKPEDQSLHTDLQDQKTNHYTQITRPEDQSLRTLPNMAMQTDIRRYGLCPVEHQAVTVPGPQPQRGPPAATGKANQEEKRR